MELIFIFDLNTGLPELLLGLCPGKGKRRCLWSYKRHTSPGSRRGGATHCNIWRSEENSLGAPSSINSPLQVSVQKPEARLPCLGSAALLRLGPPPQPRFAQAAARPRTQSCRRVSRTGSAPPALGGARPPALGAEGRERRRAAPGVRRDRKTPEPRPSLSSCGRGLESVRPRVPDPLMPSARPSS